MTINNLHLENWKCFKDLTLDMRPLTILAGANSAGKSTVLASIAAILQSRSPYLFPFDLVLNGPCATLGSYRSVVHGRSTRNQMKISLTTDLGDGNTLTLSGQFRYASAGNQVLPQELSIKESNGDYFTLSWYGEEKGYQIRSYNKIYADGFGAEEKEFIKNFVNFRLKNQSKVKNDALDVEQLNSLINEVQKSASGELKGLKAKTTKGLIEEIESMPYLNSLITSANKAQRRLLTNVEYIGPIRAHPSRFYTQKAISQDFDPAGNDAINTLLEWKKYSPKRFDEVLSLLKRLGLAESIDAQVMKEELILLNIKPPAQSKSVNIADVGFGVSQILPVLIADVGLSKGGTLLVNQPEVHLHPSSQAELASIIASRLTQRQYIIETHSEYFINRLRLLVTKGKLDPEKVIIYYFDRSGINDSVKKWSITLGKTGEIIGAPDSFFETYAADAFDLAMSLVNDDELPSDQSSMPKEAS